MKILISSHAFSPSVGGLQKVSEILAAEFVCAGHEVIVITQTPASVDNDSQFNFPIIRNPGIRKLIGLVRWADVFFQSNISLRTLWPLLLYHRPWVVTHHIWIPHDLSIEGFKGRFKRWLLRWAKCISISREIAKDFDTPSVVIPNPYETKKFITMPNVSRKKELVFVGRLVTDKGVDLLIEALHMLSSKDLTPHLTIVGAGPELASLQELVISYHLESQVVFTGVKLEESLVDILNQHQILVIPSRWNEPFGIVALEGLACGCVVIGSAGGGLKEAIGLGGRTFPNGDVVALKNSLFDLLISPEQLSCYRWEAQAHLSKHAPEYIAAQYLSVFEESLHADN